MNLDSLQVKASMIVHTVCSFDEPDIFLFGLESEEIVSTIALLSIRKETEICFSHCSH